MTDLSLRSCEDQTYGEFQLGFDFIDNPLGPEEIERLADSVDLSVTKSYVVIENLFAIGLLMWETTDNEIAEASLEVLQGSLTQQTCEEHPGIADMIAEQIWRCYYTHPRKRVRKSARNIIDQKGELMRRFPFRL